MLDRSLPPHMKSIVIFDLLSTSPMSSPAGTCLKPGKRDDRNSIHEHLAHGSLEV